MSAAVSPYARCESCGIEHCRHFDGWDGSPLGCEETSRRWGGHYAAPAASGGSTDDDAEPPAATFREYTFSVYLTVREPANEDDVDGYTRADVVALVKRLLDSYNSRREMPRYGGDVAVDWELMESAPVSELHRAER